MLDQKFSTSYSKLINGLSKNNILINRKVLSDIAINDRSTFEKIARTAVNKLQMSGMDKIEPPTIADDIGSLHPINQTKDYL